MEACHEAVAAGRVVEGEICVLCPHVHNVEHEFVSIQRLKARLDGLRARPVPAAGVALHNTAGATQATTASQLYQALQQHMKQPAVPRCETDNVTSLLKG